MTTPLYLGIDQGSSATKGILIDREGRTHAEFYVAVPARVEEERKVEQDPEGLLSSVVELFNKAREWARINDASIEVMGIAAQRSGVLAWRAADGVPVHPMITWADTRTHPIIQSFGPGSERISTLTGLPTIPNFAAGKIHLLQRAFQDPTIKVGTLDSFLLYRLSARAQFATEDTMAARTMLYALKEGKWSETSCGDFKVDMRRLAPIHPSLHLHATYEGVPIVALLGDQQAAVIGRPGGTGFALLNLGTISSLIVETGQLVKTFPGLMASVLFSREKVRGEPRVMEYLVETTSAITGTVLLEPIRRGWCKDSSELNALCESSYRDAPMGRAIAYLVHHRPTAPWYPESTPNVFVCKPEATTADRVRAVVENVGNLVARMIEEFADKGLLGPDINNEIVVTGGGSDLDYLLQYLADITGRTLHRMKVREATARGAALAAIMQKHNLTSARDLTAEAPAKSYRTENPDRRRRFLMWCKLEQDLLNKALPPHAEVEG